MPALLAALLSPVGTACMMGGFKYLITVLAKIFADFIELKDLTIDVLRTELFLLHCNSTKFHELLL